MKFSKYKISSYADDTQIIVSAKSPDEMKEEVETVITTVPGCILINLVAQEGPLSKPKAPSASSTTPSTTSPPPSTLVLI